MVSVLLFLPLLLICLYSLNTRVKERRFKAEEFNGVLAASELSILAADSMGGLMKREKGQCLNEKAEAKNFQQSYPFVRRRSNTLKFICTTIIDVVEKVFSIYCITVTVT